MTGAIYREMEDLKKTRALYNQLLYAVGTKYPDETRHETALRYITEAESHDGEMAQEAGEAQA